MKKIKFSKVMTELFDVENGEKREISLYNKEKSLKMTLGSEGESVWSYLTVFGLVDETIIFSNFDDALFRMTTEEIFYV